MSEDIQEIEEQESVNVSRETLGGEEQEGEEQEQEGEELQQSFSREYVEKLRNKGANYRLRAKESEQRLETVQRALFAERVQRLDLVVDPQEVPYNAELLDSEEELLEHIEELLTAKPYLRKRKAGGDIGQHDKHTDGGGFSLLGALRANAG